MPAPMTAIPSGGLVIDAADSRVESYAAASSSNATTSRGRVMYGTCGAQPGRVTRTKVAIGSLPAAIIANRDDGEAGAIASRVQKTDNPDPEGEDAMAIPGEKAIQMVRSAHAQAAKLDVAVTAVVVDQSG